ncbi:hypothetical protein CLOM_g12594 [Closterium sp. NIES-68]|nr:hypothetical protein CLOM_g12594 [Closterium sp. NIES-68]
MPETQGVVDVLIELTQEVQEVEESITNKVHELIARMDAVDRVQEAEEHLQRLEESVEGIRGLVEGVRMKLTERGDNKEMIFLAKGNALCHQQQEQQTQQQRQLQPLECHCHVVKATRRNNGDSLIGVKRRMKAMDAQLWQQVAKVQRIEKGLQSLATFHSTQLIKGFTTLDLSALPSPSYHTLLFHLLTLSLHHSPSLSTISTVKAFPSMTTPCLQQTISLQLPALRKLDLSGCTRLADSDLPHIARLTHLSHLCLAGCTGFKFHASAAVHPVTSTANLPTLSNLPNLRNLPNLTTNLPTLANLTNLRRLNLSRTQVGDQGMALWCQLTGITSLDLRHCPRITCRSMYHIRQLQQIHTLNLAWAGWAGDSASASAPPGDRWVRALGPMDELAWLSLFGWRLTDEGAVCVAKFFPNLKCLRCSGGGVTGVSSDGDSVTGGSSVTSGSSQVSTSVAACLWRAVLAVG